MVSSKTHNSGSYCNNNRCRSDHYNLNSSLFRIKLLDDPKCSCGAEIQDLNHIIWQCLQFEKERRLLTNKLAQLKQYLPLDVRKFLIKPDIKVMKLIHCYLKDCKLNI